MSDRTVRCLTCLLAIFVAGCCSTFAGAIGLSWDSSAGASGYRVYYGPDAGQYLPNTLYDGPATSVTIDNNALTDCTTWHFAVTAYNVAGESGFSQDVASWPRPRIDSASPPLAMQGSAQFALTITGGNLDSFDFLHPNVNLQALQISCNQIQADVTVGPTAPGDDPAQIGDFLVTVENLNGLSIIEPVFEVLINPARFDINQITTKTDGRLDGLDTTWIATLNGAMFGNPNVQFGDPSYDPDFDFDGDGQVDGNELSHIGAYFGLCWNGSAWDLSACP